MWSNDVLFEEYHPRSNQKSKSAISQKRGWLSDVEAYATNEPLSEAGLPGEKN